MFKLVFITIILGFVSTVHCGPMPQYLIDGDQNQRQEEQKHAIDHFTTRLVGNSKIRKNYLNCFLDNGPCSPEANNIKPGMVPEAIQNECAHCTELQKKVIEKMMCYLNNHQPDILKEVAAKFDPNGEYMKQFINNLERNGNDQFLNPNLHQYQPQQNPNQPQPNPNQPHQHQPQPNPNQPHQHQPQPNPNQLHQHQPQPNPNQPHQHQPQPNPNQSHQHQPQPNLNQPHQHQPQQNPNQPQQNQHQHQPQQNPNQPSQHQHQHEQNHHQPQQYQNQPQQHQHEQQLKATVVTTAPISYTAT
ncbi:putative mediator of RNA polymerase II transcription subunit 26 [Rhopalosiphum maidis]|uniref:putative mediator of RNA polymerase II transcription subunit 26 n=1 Tax=Rhopalosiphum maidis TaxID=43146 RepID=UPI000EFFDADB|nr:putative mediator of RNA polymerase II transcription subunit 26 [Rhopalosiphum maidis]